MKSLSQHGSMLQTNEKITYCTYSDTVRLMPYNYMIYFRHCNHWICDPDRAIPILMKLDLFAALSVSHELRWGAGEDLANHMDTVLRKEMHERNW